MVLNDIPVNYQQLLVYQCISDYGMTNNTPKQESKRAKELTSNFTGYSRPLVWPEVFSKRYFPEQKLDESLGGDLLYQDGQMCMYAYIYHRSPPKDSKCLQQRDTVSLLGDVQASTSVIDFN